MHAQSRPTDQPRDLKSRMKRKPRPIHPMRNDVVCDLEKDRHRIGGNTASSIYLPKTLFSEPFNAVTAFICLEGEGLNLSLAVASFSSTLTLLLIPAPLS
jgi:hypothetical protein